MQTWRISAYDTFAGDPYTLPGRFRSQEAAERAALRRLEILELTQPCDTSGGQDGIQDKVYVHRPDGTAYVFELPGQIRPGFVTRIAWRLGLLNG